MGEKEDPNLKRNKSAITSYLIEYAPIVLLLFTALIIFSTVLFYSRFGFEQTDEGFYLSLIANSFYYKYTITQFGFVYHPVYLIFDGSITALRNFNYVSTYVCSMILCFFVLRSNLSSENLGKKVELIIFSISIAVVCFVVTCFELPQTPSYNTLAFQSAIIWAIGISLTYSNKINERFFGDVIIGLSWWIAFMAKPTTALAIGIFSVLNWTISNRFNKSAILIPPFISLILLFLTAMAIDGSLFSFIHRLESSIEIGRLLGAGNSIRSIWRWDSFPLESVRIVCIIFLAFLLFLSFKLLSNTEFVSKSAKFIICVLALFFSCLVLFLYYPRSQDRYSGLVFLAIPLGCILYVLNKKLQKTPFQITRNNLLFALLLSMLPFAYAFGTDRPYWLNAQGGALFWVLSGIVFVSNTTIDKKLPNLLIPISALACCFSAFFISATIENPMRQTNSLRNMDEIIEIGTDNSRLVVSNDNFVYLSTLKLLAINGGFKHGTPIIDLTGSSPGVVYTIGGIAPGTPWLLGGYPGSDSFANAVLDKISCSQIANSWILFSRDQASKLSTEILNRYGVNLEKDYEFLGFATRPPNPFPQSYRHYLLKPKLPYYEAQSRCEAKRISGI